MPLGRAFAAGDKSVLPDLRAAFEAYAALCKDHFWKESDILYPAAERMLSEADAAEIVQGIEALEASIGEGTRERYYRMAQEIIDEGELKDLAFGLDRDVLAAILNTLPVELSFIDHEDRVRYFSHEHGEKIFPRSRGAIGMEVQNCHPPKSLHMVNRILADFKAGARRRRGILDRHGRAQDPHPLLARARSRRPLPRHARDGAGRHRDPQPDGRAPAARRIGVGVVPPQ